MSIRMLSKMIPVAGLVVTLGCWAAPVSANDGGDATQTTADRLINSTTPITLVTVTTTGRSLSHTHICLVTASAEATFLANGRFVFGVNLDNSAPLAAADPHIEMNNYANVNDDDFEEVVRRLAFPDSPAIIYSGSARGRIRPRTVI